MRKIPRLFIHEGGYATKQINPLSKWVTEEPSIPYRKWDGTPVMMDEDGKWWARRMVRHGAIPSNFQLVELVNNVHYGWIPIESSSFWAMWKEAYFDQVPYSDFLFGTEIGFDPGTYELMGPRITGNKEKLKQHWLMPHKHSPQLAELTVLDPPDITYDRLFPIFETYDYEGCVWYSLDKTKMTKLRVNDFQWEI